MEVITAKTDAISNDNKAYNIEENLKSILEILNNEQSVIKNLIANVRTLSKNYDRQSKDYDKLRNKKSRASGDRKASDTPCGITKPVAISDELAKFLGVEPGTLVPRNEVTKGVSSYVRKYELSDPANKQKFVLGTKPEGVILQTLLGNPAEEVTYFNLQRYLKQHYVQSTPSTPKKQAVNVQVVVETPAPVAPTAGTASTSEAPKKKTVLVKKKVSTPLVEDK